MGWETRGGGRRYYTRSRRVDGRIVREYVGAGPVAEVIAGIDAEERAARAAERGEERRFRTELERLDTAVEVEDAAAEALMRAALLAAGFHRHHGGEWRRRRG